MITAMPTRRFRCARMGRGLVLVFLLLSACDALSPLKPEPTETPLMEATTIPALTATATESIPDSVLFPLSEPGPYAMGKRRYAFEDASRDNRKISFTVWYPAQLPEGATAKPLNVGLDLDPDLSGAPYPLILSSTEMANTMAKYVVSHGFTWVSVNGIESYARMNTQMYSQPLDILFGLDRAGANAFEGLEGVFDAGHTGVIGYSFDGYNALVLSGARINPPVYLGNCENPDGISDLTEHGLSAFNCDPADNWSAYEVGVGAAIAVSDDGLWQPITDERIRAVMPMAGEGYWLFGDEGLAAVQKPVLMLAATEDTLYFENTIIYEHLGTAEKAFISFDKLDHMMIFHNDNIRQISHFAVAFFGVHLQGREDYAQYYSEEFVSQHDGLVWGPVQP